MQAEIMKNIYILYDEFLVENAHLSFHERAVQFARWYSNLRLEEVIERYREMKRDDRQGKFDEADIRGRSS